MKIFLTNMQICTKIGTENQDFVKNIKKAFAFSLDSKVSSSHFWSLGSALEYVVSDASTIKTSNLLFFTNERFDFDKCKECPTLKINFGDMNFSYFSNVVKILIEQDFIILGCNVLLCQKDQIGLLDDYRNYRKLGITAQSDLAEANVFCGSELEFLTKTTNFLMGFEINVPIIVDNDIYDQIFYTKSPKAFTALAKQKQLCEYKVYVFDLDNTLYLRGLPFENPFHKQLRENLKMLKDEKKLLYIATHHKYPNWSINDLEISDLIEKVVFEQKDVSPWCNSISDYTQKSEMIKEILSHANEANNNNLTVKDVAFFDDMAYNISEVEEIGVRCVLVDAKKGAVFEDLHQIVDQSEVC
jgi:HAD superfamily phosphatase (TIGR01681 family)